MQSGRKRVLWPGLSKKANEKLWKNNQAYVPNMYGTSNLILTKTNWIIVIIFLIKVCRTSQNRTREDWTGVSGSVTCLLNIHKLKLTNKQINNNINLHLQTRSERTNESEIRILAGAWIIKGPFWNVFSKTTVTAFVGLAGCSLDVTGIRICSLALLRCIWTPNAKWQRPLPDLRPPLLLY